MLTPFDISNSFLGIYPEEIIQEKEIVGLKMLDYSVEYYIVRSSYLHSNMKITHALMQFKKNTKLCLHSYHTTGTAQKSCMQT